MRKLLAAIVIVAGVFGAAAPAIADEEEQEEKRAERPVVELRDAEKGMRGKNTTHNDPVTGTFCRLWNGECVETKRKKDEKEEEEGKPRETDKTENPEGQPETMPSGA